MRAEKGTWPIPYKGGVLLDICIKVDPIKRGCVFDHLMPYSGVRFIATLESIIGGDDHPRVILQGVPSKKWDTKDVIKITKIAIPTDILGKLHDIYPRFTYSQIKDGCVVKKYRNGKYINIKNNY